MGNTAHSSSCFTDYRFSSSHPLILSSYHPPILSSSHPLILSSSHPLILSSSHTHNQAEKLQKLKEKEKRKRAATRKKETKAKEEAEAVEATAALVEQKRNAQVAAENAKEAAKTLAGVCSQCSKPLIGLYPHRALDFFDQRCCSPACVMACRRRLAADAAMRRMEGK
jgi:hypothetical protein